MKKLISILIILLMVISLFGCSSKQAESAYEMTSEIKGYDYASAVDEEAYSGLGVQSNSATDAYAPVPEPEAVKENQSGNTEIRPEKIIYTGNATIETTQFDTAIESVKKLIENNNGFLQSSSIDGQNYNSSNSSYRRTRDANFTIRIPNDKFESVMSSLSSIGNVPRNEVYTENISSQYYDAQARLSSYQATEKRLIELLEKAQSVSDVIEIERELSDVRYNIESIQSTIKGWDNQVSYSTIYIYLKEVSEYTPEKTGFFYDLLSAIKSGFENLGDFVLGVVEILPVLLVLAAVIFGIVELIMKIRRNQKKRKVEEKKSDENVSK